MLGFVREMNLNFVSLMLFYLLPCWFLCAILVTILDVSLLSYISSLIWVVDNNYYCVLGCCVFGKVL